jgi:hypothetical protein
MSFLKNLFGARQPSSAQALPDAAWLQEQDRIVTETGARNLPEHRTNIESAKTPATSYAESVFAFDLTETPEARDWRTLDELKDVPAFFSDNNMSQLEGRLSAALASQGGWPRGG